MQQTRLFILIDNFWSFFIKTRCYTVRLPCPHHYQRPPGFPFRHSNGSSTAALNGLTAPRQPPSLVTASSPTAALAGRPTPPPPPCHAAAGDLTVASGSQIQPWNSSWRSDHSTFRGFFITYFVDSAVPHAAPTPLAAPHAVPTTPPTPRSASVSMTPPTPPAAPASQHYSHRPRAT
jgi:hypothetical protein